MEAMDWIRVEQNRDASADCCEYGNEPLGSIKFWGFFLVSVDLLRKKIQSPLFYLVRMSNSIRQLHCYYVERAWLTGTLMILVELDTVAIWWAKQEALRGKTLKNKNKALLSYRP